jgi:hypothetical protein
MADNNQNQPPGNVLPPADLALQDCSIALQNLRGTSSSKQSVKWMLDAERARRASAEKKLSVAEKKLVEAQKKIDHLCELRERINLELAKVATDNKCLTDLLKSRKSLEKTSTEGQKAASKKQLESHKAQATIHLNAKITVLKAAQSAKAALKKDFDKQKKAYDALFKANESNKSKILEYNGTQVELMRAKTALQIELKSLTKDFRALKKKADSQFVAKQEHEVSMQRLKNESKQLDLEQAQQRFEMKKAPTTNKTPSAAALTLQNRMELESHKVECKRRTKDDDAARDKMKKDNKARDIQSNISYTTNMMRHNNANMTGGMWQQGTVQDVSC